MNRVQKWLRRALLGMKGVDFIPADAAYTSSLPRTRYPYANDVHGGLHSNVVMSPINWVQRNFTEAEPVVERKTGKEWAVVDEHPLATLLDAPNPFYDGDTLWKATLVSFLLDGNAYWQKVRNRFGEVLGLWYLPHFLVEPRYPQDGSVFISHYEYRPVPSGLRVDLPVRDVVHYRFGLDPENPRKGLSVVKPILREVFTDEEASNFSASILRNMGVPGGVIAPKDGAYLPSKEDVTAMKEYMRTGFTGDRRGDWLVLGTPTETSQFGFDPQSLMLGNLRDIAEERVCAALGVPAAVVGFGAGLQQTKVGATMRELRQSAWHNCVIPQQKSIAKQLTRQIMPDFATQVRRFRVRFDRSMVSAFQEEETERAERLGLLVEKGILRVDKAQELAGVEVDPSQAVYLRPSGAVAVAVGDSALAKDQVEEEPDEEEVPPAVAARMNGNGNGAE